MFSEENKNLEKILLKHNIIRSKKYELCSLTGGVSSDIWKIDDKKRIICLKKAKKKLKVKQNWNAPLVRNMYEASWNEEVYKNFPFVVPKVLFKSKKPYFFVMHYYDEKLFPVWKKNLLANNIDYTFAIKVAEYLYKIHNIFFRKNNISKKFDNMHIFSELRIKPYVINLIKKHIDLKEKFIDISLSLSKNKMTLIHGDISPKNILVKNKTPIFLDAECATYGDPAFDIAFCLNHLMLKKIKLKDSSKVLQKSFDLFIKKYLQNVNWENPKDLEKRVSKLLPVLMLSRIDGKSPVEYITEENEKDEVRLFSRNLIIKPVKSVSQISNKWFN